MAKKSFAERTARIQKQLDDAAAAKVTADGDAKNIRAALGDVASERARILAEADAQAASVLADGRARITSEIAELEAKAEADINAARGRGSDELRNEITVLASRATPLVVAATLNLYPVEAELTVGALAVVRVFNLTHQGVLSALFGPATLGHSHLRVPAIFDLG
jgi:F0F1-type ATP synthase membrane subunit b/b'